MSRTTIISLLIAATVLLLIKVYVANEIYYTSRTVQKTTQQINALKEERNILQLKIEKLKYKNTIVDPLFNYMPPKVEDNIENNKSETKINTVNPKKKKDAKELFETINIGERF